MRPEDCPSSSMEAYNEGFADARSAAISIAHRWAKKCSETGKDLLSHIADELEKEL